MLEYLEHPAFYPALYGFLGGVVLIWLISAVRLRLTRAAARAAEKAAAEKVSSLVSEKSALENEIATLRSTESRIMKHQGELEARAKSDQQRDKDLGRVVKSMQDTLETIVAAREKTLLEAIAKIAAKTPPATAAAPQNPVSPAALDEDDFVPPENLPAAEDTGEEDSAFEGFDLDQTAAKAESAANAFRDALKGQDL